MQFGYFEAKGCTTYRGHEGETCLQGNLYFKGKKIGSFNENSWSGDIDYDLDEKVNKKELEKAASDYFEQNKFGCPLKPEGFDLQKLYQNNSISGILSLLHEFYFIEKRAKKGFKDGYDYYVIAKKSERHGEISYSCMEKHIAEIKKEYPIVYVMNKKDFGIA